MSLFKIRCHNCQKNIIEYVDYQSWLSLFHYFEHEYLEGEITKETFDIMIERLMVLKPECKDESS